MEAMKMNDLVIVGVAVATAAGCTSVKNEYASYELYPVRSGSLTEMEYTSEATHFSVWAPTADEVRLMLYEAGEGGHAYTTVSMEAGEEGVWHATVKEDLMGKFYTFNIKIDDQWLGDTPGINAKAVGVNGKRAAIIDMKATDPEGWAEDRRPPLQSFADIVIYEMHHRDFSVSPASGIEHKGKFLAMTEEGTLSPEGLATGIDHLKELGVTHVHLLPSYDYASVDETKLSENQYNWGYDPQNYNVPDGSYSTDPYDPATRIREFKQMVQALHKAGIRVILDVVYNHTFNIAGSNFERTAPGYFYRQKPDGTYADASACGNETASDRPMMRKYMIESVLHWVNEYHIDGFRFDLMGIHDIKTMNEIRAALTAVDPSIVVYGEGWAAQAPQLPQDSLAMKANTHRMPGIAAFSDEMRDALRGPFNDNKQGAFLAGLPGGEESIKFGIVGAVQHPQVCNDSVNYYQSPDSINAIDWSRKALHADVFAYYKGLIQLRKNHPAFRLGDADLVRRHLEFLPVEGTNVVAWRLKEHAGGDKWEDIVVVLNSRREPARVTVPQGSYTVVCKDGFINEGGLAKVSGTELTVPAQSALIAWK